MESSKRKQSNYVALSNFLPGPCLSFPSYKVKKEMVQKVDVLMNEIASLRMHLLPPGCDYADTQTETLLNKNTYIPAKSQRSVPWTPYQEAKSLRSGDV